MLSVIFGYLVPVITAVTLHLNSIIQKIGEISDIFLKEKAK